MIECGRREFFSSEYSFSSAPPLFKSGHFVGNKGSPFSEKSLDLSQPKGISTIFFRDVLTLGQILNFLQDATELKSDDVENANLN